MTLTTIFLFFHRFPMLEVGKPLSIINNLSAKTGLTVSFSSGCWPLAYNYFISFCVGVMRGADVGTLIVSVIVSPLLHYVLDSYFN